MENHPKLSRGKMLVRRTLPMLMIHLVETVNPRMKGGILKAKMKNMLSQKPQLRKGWKKMMLRGKALPRLKL